MEAHSTDSIVTRSKTTSTRKILLIAVLVSILTGFVIGILIGRFATCPDEKPEERKGVFLDGVDEGLIRDADPEIADLLINSVRSENIRKYLKNLSDKPHIAGSERNHELGRQLVSFWKEHGIDHVTLTPYQVLLSYPNMSDLNYVELLDEKGDQKYKSNLTEPFLTPEENKTGVVPPFNAFFWHGDIKGELVYVNYGRVEDYITLENLTAINVTGKIVLARYGKIFRGDKVHLAEIHGASGIILFSDPADSTGGDIHQVYPRDWWLPPSGAQRGTVFIGDGDPLTPGYPSIETAYPEPENETTFYLPKIPSHPIGYGIAIKLMEQLAGDEVPMDWRGGMNVSYRFGGSFKTPGWKAHIMVSTRNRRVTTYNAFGTIRGRVEPDRYVLVGNHRDAWVFGAMDPSSGTALMMEISRVMGELVKTGRWRPRRSILFCSWGAEEYGLVGSTEWVEYQFTPSHNFRYPTLEFRFQKQHYSKILGARAVAYLNIDIAVQGNVSLRALGTPLTFQALYDATKKVPNPNKTEVAAGRTTVYDTWVQTYKSERDGRPVISLPGSGSDYAPFRDRLGVPCVDIRYTYDTNTYKISSYPLYHSVYETFYAVDEIIDRGFKYHTATGQVWMEMARNLADSLIIPFNLSDYAVTLEEMKKTLLKNYGDLMQQNGIITYQLSAAITNFTEEVTSFQNAVKHINTNDPYAIRLVNDKLMDLDRAFLDPAGLPGRSLKRHILFAESSIDTYSGSSFPGLADAMFEIEQSPDPAARWKIVQKHYSVILYLIQAAGATLRDVSDFMYSY